MAKLKLPLRLSYAVGQIGVNAKDLLFHYYFVFFFSTVVGLPGTWVGLAALLALAVDAITDPLMGGISDGWRSRKWGRRHLFMLVSAIPLAASLWLLFSPPAGLSDTWMFVWMLGFAIAVRLSLTLFYVPYIALNSELTSNYEERTALASFRIFFGYGFGIVFGVIILTIFLADTPQYPDGRLNPDGYTPIGVMAGIATFIAVLITVFGTRGEIPRLNEQARHARTQEWWRPFLQVLDVLKLMGFARLVSGFTLFSIMAGVTTALTISLLTYFWKFDQNQMAAIFVSNGIAIIPAALLAPRVAKWLDKAGAVKLALGVFVVFNSAPVIVQMAGLLPPLDSPEVFYFALVFYHIGQMGTIAFLILGQSMMADITDAWEDQSGTRQEGLLYSSISFAQKATFGIGTFIAGVGLDVIRFPRETLPGDVPAPVIDKFGILFSGALIITSVICFVCFIGYPITRAVHAAILARLEKRRVEQSDYDVEANSAGP